MRSRLVGLTLMVSLTACLSATPAPLEEGGAAVGGLNPADRGSVVSAYQTIYSGAANNPVLSSSNWTGNVGGCKPGDTSSAFKEAVLRRINFYRALAGLPNVTYAAGVDGQQQAAALMMAANGTLSHSPPGTWKCYSDAGKTGAGSSNLAGGNDGVNAIDAYMDDGGGNNSFAGHRRWILYPPRLEMASGDVPGWNALYVFGKSGPRPANPRFVTYPTAGFFPRGLLPTSKRWSFSVNGADFSTATITMSANGSSVPLTKLTPQNGYGDNTVVWEVAGALSLIGDAPISVKLEGVNLAGAPQTFSYVVTLLITA